MTIVRAIVSNVYMQLLAVALAGWAALGLYGYAKKKEGAAVVVVEINKQVEVLTNEAVAAREPASKPGAADRLRKHYCRDCKTNVSSGPASNGVKR